MTFSPEKGIFTTLLYVFFLIAWFPKVDVTAGSENSNEASEENAYKPPQCNTSSERGIVTVDCSRRNFIFLIPQDLNENVNVLNLSHNKVVVITNWSFGRYEKSLIKLDVSYLRYYNNSFRFDPDSFSRLRNLQYLDLSNKYECLVNNPVLPRSIKILKIEGCRIRNWNLATLTSLEELYAARNDYSVFPFIHFSAPLKYLDLRDNPIWSLEIENIAPFCKLQTVLLESFPPKYLAHVPKHHNATTYCMCYNLNLWLTYIAINYEELDCTLPADGTIPSCIFYPSNEALQMRYNCLSRRYPTNPAMMIIKTNWWWILILLVVILIIMASGFVLLKRKRYRRPKKVERNKKWKWNKMKANETKEIMKKDIEMNSKDEVPMKVVEEEEQEEEELEDEEEEEGRKLEKTVFKDEKKYEDRYFYFY